MISGWFSFLTYAIITSVTPGPNNIMSMINGSRRGFREALPFNFGIWTGFSFTLLWSAFGSAFRRLFSQHSRKINTVMALLLVCCAVSLFL